MKRFLGVSLTVAVLGLVRPVAAADIRVMTQNQYLGADLMPLFAASDFSAFNDAALLALRQVAATRPAERIRAMADEIAKQAPEFVGLQEVVLFRCVDLAPSGEDIGCNDPALRGAFVDHLQGTLDALNGTYQVKAVVTNLDLTTPGVPLFVGGFPDGFPVLVQVVDRDVILARSDITATPVDFTGFCSKPSTDGCNYDSVLFGDTPLGRIFVERGFVAVDATVQGKDYRFVNTHLEQKFPPQTGLSIFQALQASQLLRVLQQSTPAGSSLIVVGDTNSSPVDRLDGVPTPYEQFVGTGFTDAWTLRPGEVPGLSCCQLADLSNHNSVLYERVDMLFSLDPPANAKQARVVGATVSDKTPPPGLGLWPSDHGAVSGELQFQ